MEQLSLRKEFFRYRSGKWRKALRAAKRAMEVVQYGSDEICGIIDRATKQFLWYKDYRDGANQNILYSEVLGWPSFTVFTTLLQTDERRFITKSIEQVKEFLMNVPFVLHSEYRLTLDCCLGEGESHCRRMMVHLRFISPNSDFPAGLCLYGAHVINDDQRRIAPLRTFTLGREFQSILFLDKPDQLIQFTVQELVVLEQLRLGKSSKVIAAKCNKSDYTIRNMIRDCREKYALCNTPHFIAYFNAFRGK